MAEAPATGRNYLTVVPGLQYFLDLVPCRSACPVRTNAGGYVRAIGVGDTAGGYAIARAPNPLASTCGRICAHPCETKCRRGLIDEPISIRALKRTVTERHGVESAFGTAAPFPLVPLGLAAGAADGARAGRRGRGRAGRDRVRPRSRAARLPGHHLRRGAGRRRHALPGRSGIPPAAGHHPGRSGPRPRARRRAEAQLAARARLHGERPAPQRVLGGVSRPRRLSRPRPRHSRAPTWTA